ncbi:histidine kinase [Neobacillus sp. DY30]|uniref:sensor histidine kinase n=1 Tax=Neobacillus sp. DY30 TaxID=3047871 RepID=UPI0024BFFD85|nr:histidine kinase [Neobacillus sp. DY30]WHY02499.1 histidine kinase [Neobacillus sp. DY30]
MKTTENPLNELIASNLYARYSGILSLSDIPLVLVDTNGHVMHELIPAPDFCRFVCKKQGDQKVCPDYNSRFNPDKGEKGRFICHYGLHNIFIPIKKNDETVGFVSGMKVYSQDTEYQKYMIDIQSLKEEIKTELEFIAKSIASLKTVDENKMKIHEQICSHIAKNISIDLTESTKNHTESAITRLSIEKEMLEKKIIDLEAKNMSLVVNPHFLFNTLNCIARIAYFEHSHKTEELIYCLSDLLRYNLKQDDQLHTIGSEIDNIEKYLYIQKARFKNRLEYTIDVPENIRAYRIPNMVIQPIVENALIHGITPRRDGGKIHIITKETEKAVIITVADNGNGFCREAIEKIKQSENKSGLGFRSTDRRLKQNYGECYGLEIIKSDFSGSTVAIKIPNQMTGRP